MSTYYVTSHAISTYIGSEALHNGKSDIKTRVLIIEADYFRPDEGLYNFYKRVEGTVPGVLVASVSDRGVFSVVEADYAYQGDFLANLSDDEDEPDSDSNKDEPEPLTVFQGQHGYKGSKFWGFWFFDDKREVCVFVPFGDRGCAERGLQYHKNGGRNWVTWPLSETTPVEETIQ